MNFKENRVTFLTSTKQKKIDEETARVKSFTVDPTRETVTPPPSFGMAKDVKTPTIFEGGPTRAITQPPEAPEAFDVVVEEVETPTGDIWFNTEGIEYVGNINHTSAGEYYDAEGNPLFNTPEEAAAWTISSTPETEAPAIPPTDWVEGDNEWDRNRKTNEKNKIIARETPGFTYERLPENQQEAIDIQLKTQGDETAYRDIQNQLATELEDLGLKNVSESVKRSISSARAGFTQGRSGGVYSTANARIPAAVRESANRIFLTAKIEIQSARNQRTYYEEQLVKAQDKGNTILVEQFQRSIQESRAREKALIKAAEADSFKIEEAMAASVSKQQEEAMSRIETLIDSPSAASTMNVADLADLAELSGYTPSVAVTLASGIIADAKLVLTIDKTKDLLEYQTALLNYKKAVKSLENPVVESIEAYKKLKASLDAGEISQEYFDKETGATGEKSGTGSWFKFEDDDGNVWQMDKNTGTSRMVVPAGSSALPASSNGGLTSALNEDGSISIFMPEGYKAQCGRLVNDFFGRPSWMGTTFDDKMRRVDSNIDFPEVGMTFVIPLKGKYAANGHTGIVTSINADGTVGTLEANLNDDLEVVEHTRNISDILNGGGFGRNPNPKKEEEKEEIEVLELTPAEKKNAAAAGITLPESGDFNDLSALDQTFVRNDIKSSSGLNDILRDIGTQFNNSFEGDFADFEALKGYLDLRNIPKDSDDGRSIYGIFNTLDFDRAPADEGGGIINVRDRGTIKLFTSGNIKTIEDAQKVADFLLDIGYDDEMINMIFERLDEGDLEIADWRYKDGKVVEQGLWGRLW